MKLYSTILSTLSEFDREFIVFHFVLTENTKTEYDKSKEKELLQEMLEVVEKREQLISDVEDTKKRLKILVDSLYKTMIKVLKTIFLEMLFVLLDGAVYVKAYKSRCFYHLLFLKHGGQIIIYNLLKIHVSQILANLQVVTSCFCF